MKQAAKSTLAGVSLLFVSLGAYALLTSTGDQGPVESSQSTPVHAEHRADMVREHAELEVKLRTLAETEAFQQELAWGQVDLDSYDADRRIEPPTPAEPD